MPSDPGLWMLRVRMGSKATRLLQPLQDVVHLRGVERSVFPVVDLDERRPVAGAQALDRDQRELPVGARLAVPDAETCLEMGHQVVRAPERARQRTADLDVMAAGWRTVEHRVERHAAGHARRGTTRLTRRVLS